MMIIIICLLICGSDIHRINNQSYVFKDNTRAGCDQMGRTFKFNLVY